MGGKRDEVQFSWISAEPGAIGCANGGRRKQSQEPNRKNELDGVLRTGGRFSGERRVDGALTFG